MSLSHQRDAATQSAHEATAARKIATANEARARESEAKAKEFATLQRRENARMNILLADAAVLASDLPGLKQALDRCPPDLRDQTWEYLAAKRDVSLGELKVAGFERPTALAAVPGQPGCFALAAANGDIGLVDVAEGTVRRVIRTGRSGAHLLAFSSDGKLLAIARRGSAEVDVFDPADGRRLHTITLTQTNLHWLGVAHHRDYSLLTAIAHAAATDPEQWLAMPAPANSGIQDRIIFRTSNNAAFNFLPCRTYGRHDKRLMTVHGDGHFEAMKPAAIGLHLPEGDPNAQWDRQ